jgi:hypothetical protein
VYFTDRGIEELDDRRGAEQVAISWLAERLRDFVDEHPETEATIESLATWLARLDDDEDAPFAEPAVSTEQAFSTEPVINPESVAGPAPGSAAGTETAEPDRQD